MGDSGMSPEDASESCFVAAEGTGVLVPHVESSGDIVALTLQTTRVVGTVDAEGFLTGLGLLHPDQGTLASTLVLTIRAKIDASVSGTLGSGVDVEVILHRDLTGRERSLGQLVGSFGTGWQTYRLDVMVLDVRFPADPCPGQDPSESCGRDPVPRPNEVSFVFTGDIEAFPLLFEVDWMTLEPKDQPGLAWRPVLLVHGLGATSASMRPGTAWVDGLQARDVASYAVNLTPKGSIDNNGAELVPAVADLRRRFGVDRVHLLGHSKGGIDAREYVRHHDDVETLIMLAAPNGGSFIADVGAAFAFPAGAIGEILGGTIYMTSAFMRTYNFFTVPNAKTIYVTAAGDRDGPGRTRWRSCSARTTTWCRCRAWGACPMRRPGSTGPRTPLTDHSGMRFNTGVVDDLVPAYIAVLTPPSATAAARGRGLGAEDTGAQTLTYVRGGHRRRRRHPRPHRLVDAVDGGGLRDAGRPGRAAVRAGQPLRGQDRRGDPAVDPPSSRPLLGRRAPLVDRLPRRGARGRQLDARGHRDGVPSPDRGVRRRARAAHAGHRGDPGGGRGGEQVVGDNGDDHRDGDAGRRAGDRCDGGGGGRPSRRRDHDPGRPRRRRHRRRRGGR